MGVWQLWGLMCGLGWAQIPVAYLALRRVAQEVVRERPHELPLAYAYVRRRVYRYVAGEALFAFMTYALLVIFLASGGRALAVALLWLGVAGNLVQLGRHLHRLWQVTTRRIDWPEIRRKAQARLAQDGEPPSA